MQLFAPYTYMVSVILIYISITELVSCCDVFGIILRTDHTFLGITIVSWGYSLLGEYYFIYNPNIMFEFFLFGQI